MSEFHIPFPPSANRLWRMSGTRVHRHPKYVAWLQDAGWIAKTQKPKPVVGPYKLTIQARRPDKRRRDIDNLLKPVGDLLQEIGLVADDCHCEMISARWVTAGKPFVVRLEQAGVE